MTGEDFEIIPAILRATFEGIAEDFRRVEERASHIQIDVTDGVFAGNRGFLDIARLGDLNAHKIELHMMVQTPADFVDEIIDLNPSRCVFHIEAFLGTMDLPFVYNTIGEYTSAEMGIAINPNTPIDRIREFLPIVQYVLFMGYNPGIANQPIVPSVFETIRTFHKQYEAIPLAADGHVAPDTIGSYARAGVSRFCANTAIFRNGDPNENMENLLTLAQEAAGNS